MHVLRVLWRTHLLGVATATRVLGASMQDRAVRIVHLGGRVAIRLHRNYRRPWYLAAERRGYPGNVLGGQHCWV